MEISLFAHTLDRVPQARSLTWAEFCAEIIGSTHVITKLNKKECPLFSPVEYKPGATRGNANVVAVHMLALDFDKLSDAETDRVQLALMPYTFALYSSYSHAERFASDGSSSFRVVLPLSRPVPAAEWAGFWRAFVDGHKLPADKSRKDLAGLYALPYAPTAEHATIAFNNGADINVDFVLKHVPLSPTAEKLSPAVSAVTHKDLRQVAAKIAKRSGDKAKSEAVWLRQVADGEAYQTVTGGRHETMLAITTALAREFPTASIDSLASLLDASHTAMALEDPAGFVPEQRHVDTVRALEGARGHRDEYIAELKAKESAELAERIAKGRGDGLDTAYSEEELNRLCRANGFARSELPKRWIMRKADTCYVLTFKGYRGPYTKGEIITVARDKLAPAGISTTKMTRDGLRFKSPTELLDECSSNFEQSNVVMGIDYGYTSLDGPNITMNEATCGPADIVAEYSERAEAYAKMIGAEHLDKFLDWLATYNDLTKATCALYLEGAPGLGKSAFAQMLTRMWRTEEVVTLGNARGDFNEALARSPIVVVDEYWPERLKAADSGVFRDIVSRTKHDLSRKFLASSTLVGAIRLILMANSDRLIKFSDLDSQDSQAAVAERLLYLKIPQQSENMFLKDPTLYTHLVTDRGFAKYCLWLKQNRVVKPGRFLVSGEMSATLEGLSLASDASAQVCEWVAGIVANPKLLNRFAPLVRFEEGQILVNPAAYAGTFEQVLSGKAYKQPMQTQAGRAVAALSDGRLERIIEGKRVKFYRLNRSLVAEGIDRAHLGDSQEFVETLEKLSAVGNNA